MTALQSVTWFISIWITKKLSRNFTERQNPQPNRKIHQFRASRHDFLSNWCDLLFKCKYLVCNTHIWTCNVHYLYFRGSFQFIASKPWQLQWPFLTKENKAMTKSNFIGSNNKSITGSNTGKCQRQSCDWWTVLSFWDYFCLILGMNVNSRRLLSHIEYEPQTYCEAFYVELEAASSPLWSFVNACTALVCLCHYSVEVPEVSKVHVHAAGFWQKSPSTLYNVLHDLSQLLTEVYIRLIFEMNVQNQPHNPKIKLPS